jgi:thiol-disulfide isomerase/thioredoxin
MKPFNKHKPIQMKLLRPVYNIIFLLLFSALGAHAQSEISIGDKCPDVELRGMINYKTTTARISDFRGKLLILDFWATWCNPCVRAFEKMDSLQKEFGERIQVLPVTTQDAETVKTFFEKMQKVKKVMPVSVIEDNILDTLFKHTYIPHYVWIDANGTVRAITGQKEVTSENIEAILNQKEIILQEKKDLIKNVDQKRAAFMVANPIIEPSGEYLDTITKNDLLYHSVISKFIKGIPGYEDITDSTRITAINQSIANLYSVAIGHFQWEFLMPNRQKVEIKDSLLYYKCTGQFMRTKKYVEDDEWVAWSKDYAVCYELKVPENMIQKRFDIMLNELNTCFGALYNIEGKMEKRKVKALVLKRTTKEDKLKTKGINKPYQQNAYFYGLYNEPFSYFTGDLRQYYQLSYALIDETGYQGNVDLELNCKLSDLQQLNKELAKYGLTFAEEERDIDMIVIKEKSRAN